MNSAKGREALSFASSEVPLYYQLGTILREQIHSGAYKIGDRLPTEADLVASYGVSRITVRQALKTLEEENLIRREAGRGTFVTGLPMAPDTIQMAGSLDDLMSMGSATSVRLLDLREVVATCDDRQIFGLQEGHLLMQCARLRYFHDQPYSYIINRIPKELTDRFQARDWEGGVLMQALEEHLKVRLGDAEQTVRATLADSSLASTLSVRIGSPLLQVDRVVYTEVGRPVERVHTFYRSDMYSLKVRMHRDRQNSGDVWKLTGQPLPETLRSSGAESEV